MKVSDYIVKFVNEEMGVKDVFMLSGGGWMHLLDSLGRNKNINYICNLHEQAASIAAEAYGQYTNNIGVAFVTTGPGGTNTVTGLAAGWIDATPMMIISGQAKTADLIGDSGLRQKGVQEINIIDIVKPVTKYAVTVLNPNEIKYHLQKAYYLATTGKKGPVWVDVPLDVQGADVDENSLKSFVPEEQNISYPEIGKIIELINNSKRPLFLAGNGIYLSGAKDIFLALVNKLNIPVLTTWKTIDFFDDTDKLYVGRPGAIASRGANFNLQNCDLLISVGARLDLPQTAFNYKNFAKNAAKVLIDIDIAELNKYRNEKDLFYKWDEKVFLNELDHNSDKITYKDNGWIEQCNILKNKYPLVLDEYRALKEKVNTYVLIDSLSRNLTQEDVIVPGSSGSCSEITCQAFKCKKGQVFLNNQGLGSMGFGLPASIGACVASNKRRTICINGDGGFVMNIQELETVRRLNLPIKYFILNNDGYGSIKNMQNSHFQGFYVGCDKTSGVTLPDFEKIAKSYELSYYKIDNQADIDVKVNDVLNMPGPVICEVIISEDTVTKPRAASKKLENGSMMSMPIENMWPYLPEEELQSNLI